MIIIDKTFQRYIPPLPEEQFLALKESIRTDGQLESVRTWNGVLIDGHHRHRACQELGIPTRAEAITFPDRASAEAWVFANQVQRRNLSPDQITALAVLRGQPVPWFRGIETRDLQQLPPELLEAVSEGKHTLRTARNRHLRSTSPSQPRRRAPAPAPAPAPKPDPVTTRAAHVQELRAARVENALADRCQVLETQLAVMTAPTAAALPPILRLSPAAGKRAATAVALLSDVHAGEVVEATPANANRYNEAICRHRLQRYFAGVAWLLENNRSWADIRDLVLWFGGDLITGQIHDELAETSQSAVQTMVWLEPLLIAGVQELRRLAQVQVVCSYGNHGRDTLKPRRATGAVHSHEWGMYQRLARALPGVPVTADQSAHQYVQIYGKTVHFHHGDEIKYGGGVGGIMIPLNKASAQWDLVRRSDVHVYGHYHQRINAGRTVCNGSLKGYDAFAMSIKASPEVAQQEFFILDSTRGMTASSPVWVTDPAVEAGL